MEYRYKPQGVCSTEMIIDVENDIIKNIKITNGCNGNLKGISNLLIGMNINEVIHKLKGIKCGYKNTSCPDQIALALEKIKNGEI
nr:TIGR03905 family TSCPD domain-containing protein [Clostridia bacterium]